MNSYLLLLGTIGGFLVYHYLSNPQKLKHKVPKIKIWRIEILPTLKIKFGVKKLWIHHWLYLSVILLFIFIHFENTTTSEQLVKGILIGGIVQGLTYSDRFNLIIRE